MLTKSWLRPALRTAAFLLALLVAVQGVGHLMMPTSNRYLSGYTAGGVLGEKNNTVDVLVMGDSNTAQGISPMEWYHTYGVTGYAYGEGWLSIYNIYYRLLQIFKEQSPRVVVVCADTIYSRRGGDTYTAAAVREISGEVFPLVRFHDEWKNMHLTEYFKENNYTWRDVNKGFAPITDVSANLYNAQVWNYMNAEGAKAEYVPVQMKWYLRRIRDLCRKHGTDMLMIAVPACTSWNYSRHLGAAELAGELGVPYVDYNLREENPLGIDWRVDTPDGGSHLNVLGAQKLTDGLGEYLTAHYALEDHRGQPGYEEWDEDCAQYQEARQKIWDRAQQEADHQLQTITENG